MKPVRAKKKKKGQKIVAGVVLTWEKCFSNAAFFCFSLTHCAAPSPENLNQIINYIFCWRSHNDSDNKIYLMLSETRYNFISLQ